MTLNLVRGARDRSKNRQLSYLAYAAENSKYPVEDDGADPEGWAAALNRYDTNDDWGWVASDTQQEALRIAAKQIRDSRAPVGLLVHFGRHAWLMTGFEASADPATTDDFQVSAAEVVGPLWPSGTLNGINFDPGPGTWMTVRELDRKFDAYVEPGQPIWYGKYVTVVPQVSKVTTDEPTEAPDLQSALGWMSVFGRLSQSGPVRDFLWLP
jgi:hypothetical protein